MEKNTVLAVVLSTVVLIGFYVVQGVFFPPKRSEQQSAQPPVTAVNPEPDLTQDAQEADSQQAATQQAATQQAAARQTVLLQAQEQQAASLPDSDAGPSDLQYIIVDTELMTVALTNAGGNIISWKLKLHNDKEENVDMILSGDKEAQAFSVAFGGLDAQPVTSLFYVNKISDYVIEFYRDFSSADGKFRLVKRYEFKPRDYMFELTLTLDGGYSMSGFNFAGSAYTLSFGPQIGPKFVKLDNRYDYRQYLTFINGKRKNAKLNDIIDTRPSWAAISGKYFAFIAIPYLAQYNVVFSDKPELGITSASRLNIIRPAVTASRVDDKYHFYLGPKTQEELAVFNTGRNTSKKTGNNEFALKDTHLDEVASSRGILSPLEKLLKWLLIHINEVTHNYGVAIILLTLLIKVLFFPLTKKGSEATLRMQALAPKIKEIQEKYKNNPQKQQVEMTNFYKQEGYNPISGCLPMLLQIPIFIAMYNLFNNHFDLRGAAFIPGWIPDLSVPEYIWNFPDGFKLPLLRWTALRALPFIYVASQLIYGKVTQTPGQQQSAGQMKMMLYVMPIAFFFILYDVPSGLLIYWIFSNILTLVQQVIINKYIHAKKEQVINQPEEKTVIAPRKKKNR
jgi:YidC/Oxa1 family membrane protein insertase